MAFDLRYFGKNVLHVITLSMILILTIKFSTQFNPQAAGYISVDCGSNGQYVDNETGLLWVADKEYGAFGSNGQIQNNLTYMQKSYAKFNYQALQTFRYFSEKKMRSKYCYALPMANTNISFLIRAMFLHGNASELKLPIQFDVYINASFWMEMSFMDTDDLYEARVEESIFFSPAGGNITYVCLVPKQGVPFLSALELRLFDSEGLMYTKSFIDNKELFFTMFVRYSFARDDENLLRYPDDIYDRIWSRMAWDKDIDFFIDIPKNWSKIGPEVNNVPSKVMESAWLAMYNTTEKGKRAEMFWPFDLPLTAPGTFIYGIFYYASNTSVATTQQIQMDSTYFPPFSISSTPSQQSYLHMLNKNWTVINFFSPFILNAMELYVARRILGQTTDRQHVYVVNFIKNTLNLTTWQGDPCTPIPHNWIGCYLEYERTVWLIDTLTLSQFKDVSGLTHFDSRAWPGRNAQTVNYMSITESNINSTLFKSLLETFVQPAWLISLNLSSNNISIFPNSQWWFNAVNFTDGARNLTSLDLSHNKLAQIPCFKDIPYFSKLHTLNVSNNIITGEFPGSECFSNLPNLKVLILSNNSLHGTIPSSLSLQNLPSLQVLDISNNKLSGKFPSSFFFEDGNSSFKLLALLKIPQNKHQTKNHMRPNIHHEHLPLISLINADNNELSGTLDLSGWYGNLKQATKGAFGMRDSLNFTNHTYPYKQVFSFRNNKISGVDPGLEEFQPLIANLIHSKDFNQSGILLSKNPYCEGQKLFTQRFFCRESSSESVNGDVKKKSRKVIILGSTLGGGLLLICFTFFSLVIWKLSTKVYRMKMVEQELANRKVQPPYYSYAELKAATQNFNQKYFLGRGSFGVVYKGVLLDGTTIAVKRLFNQNNKKQVLHEFLNEVVLITGIKHRNLVQLKGCCIENEERILVYAFAKNGNVEDALWGKSTKATLSWKQRYAICVGVANGLTYLHEELQPKIIHRDVKAANILLDKNFCPQIADFGLAKGFLEDVDEHVTQQICGTLDETFDCNASRGYFAPEYFAQGRLTTKVDVFSFGVVALEIVSGRKSFNPHLPPEETQLARWALKLQRSGLALKLLDPALQQLEYSKSEVLKLINISLMCVENDPELRPSMSKVEAMLLEDEDKTYDMLCSAFLKRGKNNSSMDKLLKSLVQERIGSSSKSKNDVDGCIGPIASVLEESPLLE